ncbi:uncharacterized protein B0I36DRAFT_437097 [Microdochium trichocladiopsis]|uniref:Non-canonical purine NTP phosphatase/PRRC1 domain-containing protein n=1 Tax=Microdochium trichocladiopsis TaxID=1682393 RepID=A0A9P9BGZ3_9PEZI|nr:uncharacterized protein B0I36DRAFT_437097 [Microdochium trichocladiopsis]KAH7009079.1 hypothetical protein B0I36DRAFT_437097 [Microdochium trichocladiopsis]
MEDSQTVDKEVWWVSDNGQIPAATRSTIIYGDNTIAIKNRSDCSCTMEYNVYSSETRPSSATKASEPEITLAWIGSNSGQRDSVLRVLKTVFKECGDNVSWISDNESPIVRHLTLQVNTVDAGTGTDSSPEARAFIFGQRECVERLFQAVESMKCLMERFPNIEALRDTEKRVVMSPEDLKQLHSVIPNMSNHTTELAIKSTTRPFIRVIIPTENEHKITIIKEYFAKLVAEKTEVTYERIPVRSGVGEQPYNAAGALGALNRIRNAVASIKASGETMNTFVVAIENYIQVKGIDRPTDFGIIVAYSVTDDTYAVKVSDGVTIDKDFVEAAQMYGHESNNEDFGSVTVGGVLASRFPPIDKANWHEVVAGVPRYRLLTEAIESLSLP